MTPLPAAPAFPVVAPPAAPPSSPLPAAAAAPSPVEAGTAAPPTFEALRQHVQAKVLPAAALPQPPALMASVAPAMPTAPAKTVEAAPVDPDTADAPDTDLPSPEVSLLLPIVGMAPPSPPLAPSPPEARGSGPLGGLSPRGPMANRGANPAPTPVSALSIGDGDSSAGDEAAAEFARTLLAALGPGAHQGPHVQHRPAFDFAAPAASTDALPRLDMRSDAWLDRLAQDISAAASSDGKLSFRIVPPQLGRLDINIETRDAGVAVHMKTDTGEAQAIVASAQPRLHDAFAAQGIRVAETSVTQNGGGDLPRPHVVPQKPLIEAVNETERDAAAPTLGQPAGRFA